MSKPLDRLALLETFVRIAERGSISAAARDLGMAQGSASRQLKDLEARLGVELIRRTTHALSLTEAGAELLGDAREMLARWDALEESHVGETDALRGPLRVVAPVALGQGALADIAIDFQAAHPGVTLDWRLEDAPIRFAEIGCDAWVRIGRVPDERLIVRRLARVERLVVAVPAIAGEGAAPEALPFVTLSPFEGARIALTGPAGETRTLTVTPRLATTNILMLKRAMLAGLGAAVLPRWLVAEALADGRLVEPLPGWRAATLDVNLAYLPARRQPRRLTALIAALEAGVPRIAGMLA